MPYSEVNYIGRKFAPKQCVSARLSISVADALQITLSRFLCDLIITQQSLVLMLNTVLFPFMPGTISSSQYPVTRFPV